MHVDTIFNPDETPRSPARPPFYQLSRLRRNVNGRRERLARVALRHFTTSLRLRTNEKNLKPSAGVGPVDALDFPNRRLNR